jgi:NADPH:quinone reductase-like Zn-dependent oxidoreductase
MSNHAVVIVAAGDAQLKEVPIPKLRDEYILVKTAAVALNPTDWKHVDFLSSPGAVVGCDYAGTVLEVGAKVTKDFKKGDRVCGWGHGSNGVSHQDGVFQEICTAKGDLQMKIPDDLSFEEAATIGLGLSTVGLALYKALQLPLPNRPTTPKQTIIIYGGATATGSLAIQCAKLSGLTVITTCSPRNFDYVKSLGALEAFDYKSSTCSVDIKAYTKDSVTYVLDCISEGNSTRIAVEAISSSGGKYCTILPVADDKIKSINDKVENMHVLVYTLLGEYFKFGSTEFIAAPENLEFGKMFCEISTTLLAEGKIKAHKPTVNKLGEGLEGVLKGMQYMRDGKVSGEKLVYTL